MLFEERNRFCISVIFLMSDILWVCPTRLTAKCAKSFIPRSLSPICRAGDKLLRKSVKLPIYNVLAQNPVRRVGHTRKSNKPAGTVVTLQRRHFDKSFFQSSRFTTTSFTPVFLFNHIKASSTCLYSLILPSRFSWMNVPSTHSSIIQNEPPCNPFKRTARKSPLPSLSNRSFVLILGK